MARRVIISDTITPRLDKLDPQMREAVSKIFDYWKLSGESAMKSGARWTDRTGNARAGLICEVEHPSENVWELYFASLATYGIWLEIRWSGKYAIVGPVMKTTAEGLAKMIADVALP